MKLLNKVIAVFLLVLFVAYSGGIGFSIHNCEHCHQKKVYLFRHPDCCSAATAEHHHLLDNCQKSSKDMRCYHQDKKSLACKKEANAPHSYPCCFSEYKFYKIQGSYFASTNEKLLNITDLLLFTEVFSFDLTPCISDQAGFFENNSDPPPLLPGGERFIVFSHQLLFYV